MMNNEEILNIFYGEMAKEAETGRINCFFTMNLPYNLIVENKRYNDCNKVPYDDLLIPTLKIQNKNQFDKLLIKYINDALKTYKSENFIFLDDVGIVLPEDTNKEKIQQERNKYLIKYIICTLLANATYDDFMNPIGFLEKRIYMLENRMLDGNICLGHLDSIGATIYVREVISHIRSETPTRIESFLVFDDGYQFRLPEIYCGLNNDEYHLYAIQSTYSVVRNDDCTKKIRKGMIAKINGAPPHYFLAAMLFIALGQDKKMVINQLLISRYNAKRIGILNIAKQNGYSDEELNLNKEKQNKIQTNLTDVLTRYFTKIESVTDGIYLNDLFYDGSGFSVIADKNINSRAVVLNELCELVKNYNKGQRIK